MNEEKLYLTKEETLLLEIEELLKERQELVQKNSVLSSIVVKERTRRRLAETNFLRANDSLYKFSISRIWKIYSKLRDFGHLIVPYNSRRIMLLRMLITLIRHPKVFIGNFTPTNFGTICQLFSASDSAGLDLHIQKQIYPWLNVPEVEFTAPEITEIRTGSLTEKDYPVLTVPQWKEPQVSIIIPVYNQFEFTYHCVESIIKNTDDITYEVLIADDCSTDLTERISEILPGVRHIRNETNLRFLLNCNNAAKYAQGKYVLFLNNDTQVMKNWLKPLIDLIESADDIGMVGSKLIYPNGKLQEAGSIIWNDGSAWNLGKGKNPELPQYNYVKEADYISGASIMLSRALWEEIGGFDERYVPSYCEDSDLAFEVRARGYRVMYQPLSVVVHFEGISNGTDLSSGLKQYQIVNREKLLKKWKHMLKNHAEFTTNVFNAQDRSFGKSTVIFVDHFVPTFDKDAGSRTVYQYIKLFVNKGYNVKFIGDNFARMEPYTTVLQQMGVEVLYGPEALIHWKDWIRENGNNIDYVFLNRPHIAPKYIDFFREHTGARIIYYGHDLAFLRLQRECEITGDVSYMKEAEEWQQQELELMRKADMSYYPSYVEVDAIHAIDPSIEVKAIPAYLFEDVRWQGYDIDTRKDIMFIGGFNHRPNVDAVKWMAEQILPELLKLIPDIKIHILGSNAPEEVRKLQSSNFLIEGFVSDEELEQFYKACKLSIVPLRYGAGIKGKVIEAMRYGIPVVTTSVGVEGIRDVDDFTVIEDSAVMIAKRIAEIYNDRTVMTNMSRNGVDYINQHFSYQNAISIIQSDFDFL